MIYLDNAATTRVCPEAVKAACEMMTENFGNPSSTYTLGRRAKAVLDTSRRVIAGALGCRGEELYFTSCGSESDNWAILSGAEAQKRVGKHMITSLVEHDAVRKTADRLEKAGWEITRLAPQPDGSIAVTDVVNALRADTALISLMMVNNETGAVTDIAAIARELKKRGSRALLHTDAVQGFLKVPFKADRLGADLISISGHKVHAPKGVGALYIRKGLRLPSFISGGGQESGIRAGTEALPQIAAFAEAVNAGFPVMKESLERMSSLRERCAERLRSEIPGVEIFPFGAPHIMSISLPGYKSEVLMNFLEAREIYISKSSACKKGGRSHVLEAVGLKNEVIDGALRLGFSRFTTPEDIDGFCDGLRLAHDSLFTVLR
ncbi:MAG: cysteine desulfurase family protein [Candidatus Heteroscillospira sp.]